MITTLPLYRHWPIANSQFQVVNLSIDILLTSASIAASLVSILKLSFSNWLSSSDLRPILPPFLASSMPLKARGRRWLLVAVATVERYSAGVTTADIDGTKRSLIARRMAAKLCWHKGRVVVSGGQGWAGEEGPGGG
jgi:hypothetical protein